MEATIFVLVSALCYTSGLIGEVKGHQVQGSTVIGFKASTNCEVEEHCRLVRVL